MSLGVAEAITISLIKEKQGQRQVFDTLSLKFCTCIHQDYEITVEVLSDESIMDALKTQNRTFNTSERYSVEVNFHQHQKIMLLQGLCTYWQGSGKYINNQEIQILTLRSELYPLFTNRRNGIYYSSNLEDVIQKGLINLSQQFNLCQQIQFEKKLLQNPRMAYPEQLSLTQYLESDMAFILRQMRNFGAWFNFYHPLGLSNTKNQNKIIALAADSNIAFINYGPVKILHEAQSQGDGLYQVKINQNNTAIRKITGVFYDEITGKTSMCTAEVKDASGPLNSKYMLPQTVLNATQMQYQTQVVADSMALRQQSLQGAFQGVLIQAGHIISIKDEILDLNNDYVLYEVEYNFSKKSNETRTDVNIYQQNHNFKAYSLICPYRELRIDKNAQEPECYRAQKYQGVMPGVFAYTGGEATVTPDHIGSIPLWFPYNYWYMPINKKPCRYTRVISQANQGGKAGVSFPYYQDTEFILMFIEGDLDRPVIKGTAANDLTGHLHSQSVQQRSAWALPQGQHLLYSNVPGDHNFLKFGATHNEGKDETHMLLSNYQDPKIPGAKKLDYQQATTQSYERVTGGNFHSQSGGMQSIRTEDGKIAPKTYLLIQLCDQSNTDKTNNQPTLTDYLSTIAANITLNLNNNTNNQLNNKKVNKNQNYTYKILLANNTHDEATKILKSVDLRLNQTSPEDPTQQVNIILLNNKPLLPSNVIHLDSSAWQNNKTTDNDGNLYYTVYLTLLPPPILFNFRHDLYAQSNALPEDQQEFYQVAKQFFKEQTYTQSIKETLSQEQINFFQIQGNNALIFIHGFNVDFGTDPTNFIMNPDNKTLNAQGNFTLYRTDHFIKTRYPNIEDTKLSDKDLLYGTAAKRWSINMEYNFNQAFGFDDQDYTKYTRIISIAWSGNPSSPVNYMAAVAMAEFPAQKVFALVKQLNEASIKIEIIAHSLGNAILARVLTLCAQANIKITHAHLWQAAIPDNALTTKEDYLSILIPNDNNQEINFPCNYDYTQAHNGAETITILFSDQDSVLGQIAKIEGDSNSLTKKVESRLQKSFTLAYKPFLYLTGAEQGGQEIWNTIKDPGAGWKMALVAAAVEAMDETIIPLARMHQKMVSIYHLANLYRYPMDYIFEGTEEDLVTYYNDWKNQFKTMQTIDLQTKQIIEIPLSETIYEQAKFLTKSHIILTGFIMGLLTEYYGMGKGLSAESIIEVESEEYQQKLTTKLNEIISKGTIQDLNWEQESSLPNDISKQAILVTTIILTCLITPNAVPRAALGYDPLTSNPNIFTGNIAPVNQGNNLSDHDAMLFPDNNMINQIYKGTLNKGNQNGYINYFGKWRPA